VITSDTHVIIWDALQPEKLSKKAKKAISAANKGDGIIFCEICLWEIAMLIKKERLRIDVGYQEFIRLVSESNEESHLRSRSYPLTCCRAVIRIRQTQSLLQRQ